MLLYYAFSMQTQQPDIINPIQYNSGNLEIAGLWLVELCPLNPIKRVRQGGRKQIFYGGARLNKKNEIMKILQILEIFTK